MGPTWRMEDIHGGTSFTETYQCASASSLPSSGTLRDCVEYGNKGTRGLPLPTASLLIRALHTITCVQW